MTMNGSRLLGSMTFALALVAAGRAPRTVPSQGSDACWFQDKAADVAQRKSAHDSASVAMEGGTV